MHHSFVRMGLFAFALVAAGGALGAQTAPTSTGGLRLGLAAGTTVPTGYQVSFPSDLGYHAQLSAVFGASKKVALRIDGLANMLSSMVAVPSCPESSTECGTYVPHPNQVYSATASAELRWSEAERLYGLIGGGAYYARGPHSTSFGTTAGAVVGLGLELASRGRAGFGIEAKYHYFPNPFGTLEGMLTPSVVFRF